MHGRNKNLDYLAGLVKRPAYRATLVFLCHAKRDAVTVLYPH